MLSTNRWPWWSLPVFSALLGVGFLVAFWIGDNPRQGVESMLILFGVGAIFVLGGRSETIRGLRGDGRDEQPRTLDLTATALCGIVLISVVIGMCFWGSGRTAVTAPRTRSSVPSPVSPTCSR